MAIRFIVSALALIALTGVADAQKTNQMTEAQLKQLTSKGRTLQLGGPGAGYAGELRLKRNGTGRGSATTDSGDKIAFSGTWEVRGNQFCRVWEGLSTDVSEVCEDWILTTPTSVDVYIGTKKIGTTAGKPLRQALYPQRDGGAGSITAPS